MANAIERNLYSKEAVELADRIRNNEPYEEEEIEALPKSERRFVRIIIEDRQKGYERELKGPKPRSQWMKFIVGVTGSIWVILAIPIALSIIGIPFAIIMLIVGGYSVLWALEKEPKAGAETKKERRNQENGEQQSRS